jgi:hypothetical protein
MTLIAHWKLNDAVTDASGNGYDLTAASLSYAAGIVGNAGSFDGLASSAIRNPYLGEVSLANTWTAFLRFNATAVNVAQVLLSNYVSGTNRVSIAIRNDGKVSCTKNDGSNTAKSASISAATWYDVFFLCDAGTISGYLSPTASPADTAMTGTDAGGVSSSARFELGTRNAGTSLFFGGLIDDVRIYDTILDATQRAAVRADRLERAYPWLGTATKAHHYRMRRT